jgi:integrase
MCIRTGECGRFDAKKSKSKRPGKSLERLYALDPQRNKEQGCIALPVSIASDGPYVTITRAWYRIRAEAGVEMRIHDLRHSFASLVVTSGRTLYKVQSILGHSDPKVTMRYAHLSVGTLRVAANAGPVLLGKAA